MIGSGAVDISESLRTVRCEIDLKDGAAITCNTMRKDLATACQVKETITR